MTDPAATNAWTASGIRGDVERAEQRPLDDRAAAYLSIHEDLLARLDAGAASER